MELDQQLPELESQQASGQLTVKPRERTQRLMFLLVYKRRSFQTAKQFSKRLTEPSCVLQLDLQHLHGRGDHHLAGTSSTPCQHLPPQGQIPVKANRLSRTVQLPSLAKPTNASQYLYILTPDESFYILKLSVLLPQLSIRLFHKDTCCCGLPCYTLYQ